ncbi:MAG: Gfo/Idh/MocA family protein [Candidatus Thorarchaeota archaeon]|nr:MAG: hypothetical protein DRP09_02485 [Candidatus Thorarchaeota archaeon]RLI60049.1 MAG: hypothetical protein DRO87_01175 [Candidatus Thorarchaeota archaeon]
MSADARLGLGLIGIGNVGTTHLNALTSMKKASLLDIDITAICDSDENVLKRATQEFHIQSAFTDYNTMLENKDIDVVFVFAPTAKRADMIKAAAKAGKAVFSKKPLASSCPQARDIMAVVLDSKVPSGIGLTLRFDPFLLYAKELLRQHDFGRPISAHIRCDQRFPESLEARSEHDSDMSITGRGTLVEQSILDLDVLTWFFGEVKSVFAKVGFFREQGVEDMASVMLTHKDGTVSTLDSIWHGVDRPHERRMEFFFEDGFIGVTLESGEARLDYQLGSGGPIRVHPETAASALLEHLGITENDLPLDAYNTLSSGPEQRYAALSYSFLTAVRNGTTPSPNFKDALALHEVVDAAYDSATRGQPVDIL